MEISLETLGPHHIKSEGVLQATNPNFSFVPSSERSSLDLASSEGKGLETEVFVSDCSKQGSEMADGYWRYADPRQQVAMAPPSAPPSVPAPLKRPRPDYGGAPEMIAYYPREEERIQQQHTIRDTEAINASYDRYLQNGISSYSTGEQVRPVGGGLNGRLFEDPRLLGVGGSGYNGGRREAPLPHDASNTLFVEGLPANSTRREVSHIFRPFIGFQEVRLVNKESRNPGGDPLVLCFVDFVTASQASNALDALQGYQFDEHDRESANLRLQFARFPGPRPSGGPRNRR